jgi:hypothetical protein
MAPTYVSPETGRTFTMTALIAALESSDKKCLTCGTRGIVAVQYLEGTALYSLSRLEIDELLAGSLKSNISPSTLQVGISLPQIWSLSMEY